MSNIIQFQPEPQDIGHYIHVGNKYPTLETLIATGRLKSRRLVCEASQLNTEHNEKLISDLSQQGYETILDTECAKLGMQGFPSIGERLPWGGGIFKGSPDSFNASTTQETVTAIAEYAVKHKFKRILAPTHLLKRGPQDPWLKTDHMLTIALREALNKAGGKHIAIDLPLHLEYKEFRDTASRIALIQESGLRDLPFENLWLRIANFGSDKGGSGIYNYINAARHFHKLGKPVIGDYIGGLVGIGIVAFGACSGMAHGLGQNERFGVSSWSKKPGKRSGGLPKRCYIPGLDRSLKADEYEQVLQAHGAKSLLGCRDNSCCEHGWKSTLQDPISHFVTQRTRQIEKLKSIHESSRPQHYIRNEVEPTERDARKAKDLNVSDPLKKILTQSAQRLDTMRQSTEKLYGTLPNATHALAPLSKEPQDSSKTAVQA